ncbi:MAG: hypothetical protein WBC83_01460 [Minisyncoccia bacterium]
MSQIKHLIVLLLFASSTSFASDFESASEFRQCAKDMNSLSEQLDKLEGTKEDLSELQLQAATWNVIIERKRSIVSGYNARMQLNSDILEYNALIAELNSQKRNHNSRVDKHSERVDEFERRCGDRTIDPKSNAWKEVCQNTNQYYEWCDSFKGN